MFAGLSLDQAPPFQIPTRFFLTAPLYLIAAACLLIFYDGFEFLNPSSPVSVALVHLFSLGFMANVMFGALLQMLPVVVGVRYRAVKGFSFGIYLLLNVGTIALVMGFLTQQSHFFMIGGTFLLLSIGTFALTTLVLLMGARFASGSVWAMRISLFALFIALLFGVHMAIGFGLGKIGEGYELFKWLHINFAFFGWILLLIIGVAFQVVPMFWVTKPYPPFCQKFVLPLVAFGLLLLAFVGLFGFKAPSWLLATPFLIALFSFSTITFRRLKDRKRKLQDTAVWYWIIGMISLLAGALIWIASMVFLFEAETLLVVIFGHGFVVSVISGMLYKIIPFLAWFHLSGMGIMEVPTIRDFIPKHLEKIQLGLYLVSFASILLSITIDERLFVASGVFLSLSALLLFYLFARVALSYNALVCKSAS